MTETRTCKNCRQEFVIEPDDFAFYEKIGVPPPTLCPECRKQRRLAWRNDMNLYPRPCDLCGKNILSIYSPESKLTVYCVKCWWTDKWDPYEYGRDYDFSRPFFEQFRELQQEVPIIALANDDGLISGSINCEYTQDFSNAKNCYMVFVAWKLEDSLYSHYILDSRGMVDCLSSWDNSDSVYEGIFYQNPRKFAKLRNCTNSIGDYLSNCKNIRDGFVLQRVEDCRWVESSDAPKSSYDLSTGWELEQCYEGITPDHSYQSRFAIFSWKNRDAFYVDGAHSSTNVFGCCGFQTAQYCILNKQYSKEEYDEMLPKIQVHMAQVPYMDKNGVAYRFGEFFPAELSYFGYNESVAQDHFLLTEQEARKRNFNWRGKLQMTVGKETLQTDEIPDGIADINDTILNEILMCIECKRNYRIVSQELQFYRKLAIPLPRRCFYCRHRTRVNFRNPFKLWHRACHCAGEKSENGVYANTGTHPSHPKGEPCPNEFETSYAPERPEIVYCEQCYNAEIA